MEKKEKNFNRGEVVTIKIEHLLQAYKHNDINTQLKNMNNENEKAGTITFNKGIVASYLLDNEDIVIAIRMFFNCLTLEDKTITNQVNHVINILNIMQQTMMLLCNISKKESNMILEKLGLFNNTFKEGKQIKHIDYIYKTEILSGLLSLNISEIIKD